jgi:MoaA/NifB/PqqE/SkfB family radical SAM enzyme
MIIELKKTMKFIIKKIILTVKTPPLNSVAIEINSACNRKCLWCPNHNNVKEAAFLDEKLFYKIIDELANMHISRITFNQYNEPLLDKRLVQFIKHVRKNIPSVYIYLNTNGDLLDLNLWKDLRMAGLDFANISQYDGKMNENVQKIFNELESEEKAHFHAHLFNTKINNRAGLVKTECSKPIKGFCERPFYQLCIDYKGKAVLCCNDYFSSVELGDVSKESIKHIWKCAKIKDYRRKLLDGDRASLMLCNKCDMSCYGVNCTSPLYKFFFS